ncbi:MAG: phosphatidylglycerophosphatase A [Bacillota bacterium]
MKTIIKFLGLGLGTGNLHPGPGTWGSLLGLIIASIIPPTLSIIVVFALAGIFICQKTEELLGRHDSPQIVYDEIIGMWIAVWNVPLFLFPVSFVLFRLFDIVKFYPINNLQKLPGGLGIMLDDIAAGIISRLLITVIMIFL